MDDTREDAQHDTPAFVPDDAATAGPEQPSVADDEARENDADGVNDGQGPAPQDFEIGDAVTRTATREDAPEEPG